MGQEDGPVGVGDGLTGVTQLPSAVSLAATFDPSLATQYGQVVGSEERGKGAMVNLGPDGEHRPRPALGPVVRGLHRGPVPQPALAVSEIDGVQSQGEFTRSSTSPSTTRRPTGTPRLTT